MELCRLMSLDWLWVILRLADGGLLVESAGVHGTESLAEEHDALRFLATADESEPLFALAASSLDLSSSSSMSVFVSSSSGWHSSLFAFGFSSAELAACSCLEHFIWQSASDGAICISSGPIAEKCSFSDVMC
ncbi:hypothetical protein BpHYR1_008298 [Brachionus plicatilis]|uniref:Secreted protein n=1 Tax=Brachionus plicatilis TaxID=10195 RepID=A0A3M7RYT1_BRAPC|nr:hypothetical protein BpHYR1_008298 [Brachionus plicatilis]